MPLNSPSEQPPKAMTWGGAVPILVLCIIFDALRLLFENFWFFGPALTATYCSVKVGGVWVIGGLLEAGCVAGATALGVFAAPVIEVFGVIMAIAVGLIGWMVVGLTLILTNARIFKENAGHALWFATSLLISEIPIIGNIPALTIVIWRMYRVQIKKEQEKEKAHAAAQKEKSLLERQQQAAQLMQMQQQAQLTQLQEREAVHDEIPDTTSTAA